MSRIRSAFRKKDGFTLIELMIVIAIIAILAGILVVQWLGARTAAFDSEARTAARNAILAAQIYFAENGLVYDNMDWLALEDIEPTLGQIDLVQNDVAVGAASTPQDGQYGYDSGRHVEDDWFQITIQHTRGSATFVASPVGVYDE